jgi:mannose-6-phosphate isomerase-like protein (cupin superfamily)
MPLMRLVRAADAPTKALGTRGVSHRIVPPESGYAPLELYVNVLEPGSGPGPYHYHSNADNIYLVLSGEGDVTVDGARVPLRSGDTIVLSAGERHDIENTGTAQLRVVEIKTPAGSDFVMTEEARPKAG